MVNRFDNNQRFSVLASTNNINSPGFSFGEIQKMFGGGGSICALTSKEKEQQVLRAILKAGAKDAYAVAISSSQNSSYL